MPLVHGEMIWKRMEELGITKKEMAEKFGVSIACFTRKINDCSGRRLTAEEAKILVKVLNIKNPMHYFFT